MNKSKLLSAFMSMTGVLVIAGTVFGASKGQTVQMSVTDKGFEPATVKVKKGQPVTLIITRKTDATCAKEIVIDEEKVNTKLPLNQPVEVKFTPKKTGELKYGCAMGKMIGGVLKVDYGRGSNRSRPERVAV